MVVAADKGYAPDIVVTSPETGDVLAVVEVTRGPPRGSDDVVAELFNYLRATGSDIALLVTPESITIFRDRSLSSDPGSMERTGPLSLGSVFDVPGSALEDLVGRWLEELASGRLARLIPAETRDALERQVMPWLRASQVSFAPPRRFDYA